MGLLDDAIREHLELKRSHGADPGEVARAEREALGPVRAGGDLAGEPHVDPIGLEVDPESRAPGDARQGRRDDAPDELYDEETTLHPTAGAPSLDPGPPHDRHIAVAGQETAEYDLGAEAGHEHEHEHPHDEEDPAQPQEPRRSWVPRLSRVRAGAVRAADVSSTEKPPAPSEEAHAQPQPPSRPDAHGEPMAGGSPAPHVDPMAGGSPAAHGDPMAGGSPAGAHAGPMAGDSPAGVGVEPPARVSTEHPPAEDVREKTPVFLRETPEHERLRFESSPRDFDFGR